MRDQVIGQPDLSLALAEPTRHVRRRWIIGLTLASLGMWMANQTPLGDDRHLGDGRHAARSDVRCGASSSFLRYWPV